MYTLNGPRIYVFCFFGKQLVSFILFVEFIVNMFRLVFFVFSVFLPYSECIWLCHFTKPDGSRYSHYCDIGCCDNKCCENPTGISTTTSMLIGTGVFVLFLIGAVIVGAFCCTKKRQQRRAQLLIRSEVPPNLDQQLPDHLRFGEPGFNRNLRLQNYSDRQLKDIINPGPPSGARAENQDRPPATTQPS